MKKEIILASSSPRRIEIMRRAGLEPTIMPAHITENQPKYNDYKDTVLFLSLKKALWVANELKNTQQNKYLKKPLIIAADTVVYKDRIMGKPQDKADGLEMLSALNGTSHYVATGVTIIEAGNNNIISFCDVTQVFFKQYYMKELEEYLDTDEAYDKAGGYAIQGAFAKYIDHIHGDYDNVVGLPWKKLSNILIDYIS